MRVVWEKQITLKAWRRAGGVLIPKEKNSSTIEQFRQIDLLHIEGTACLVPQSGQPLEVGIMAGCTISLLAFTMTIELNQSLGMGCRKRTATVWSIQAYMDNITTLTTTVLCTKRLLDKLHQNITWARMKTEKRRMKVRDPPQQSGKDGKGDKRTGETVDIHSA